MCDESLNVRDTFQSGNVRVYKHTGFYTIMLYKEHIYPMSISLNDKEFDDLLECLSHVT